MKKLLAILCILSLSGCLYDSNDDNIQRPTPGPGVGPGPGTGPDPGPEIPNTPAQFPNPADLTIEITPNREERAITATWDGSIIPAWAQYRLCTFDNSLPNNCDPIVSGDGRLGVARLSLGNPVTLAGLLVAKNDPTFLFIEFVDTRTTPETVVEARNLVVTDSLLNFTVQYLKSANPAAQDFFAQSVSISGDGKVVAVGISQYDITNAGTTTSNAGAIEIFTDKPTIPANGTTAGQPGGWQRTAFITRDDANTDDSFGRNLSLNHDGTVLAAAIPVDNTDPTDPSDPTTSIEGTGSVAIYTRAANADTWVQDGPLLFAREQKLNLGFGFGDLTLSSDGSTLAVTSAGPGATTASDLGVTVYTRGANAWNLLGSANILLPAVASDDLAGARQH